MIEFNVNKYVFVRLTDTGRSALEQEHKKANIASNGFLGEFTPPDEDIEGWSRWQMWALMNSLGSYMSNGFAPPFETTIRIDN